MPKVIKINKPEKNRIGRDCPGYHIHGNDHSRCDVECEYRIVHEMT